ncbi:MAG: CHAD domain-containing protein [Thermomicrobiales bacterium]|nr:CHAD domain-containing protein [Thermomicrobiales bacterium]
MTDETYRAAMRARIGERWEVVWTAIPRALDPADAEGVHDVRVASRRLRAAMDIASPAFPAAWFGPLHKLARNITVELGVVRDREVMLGYLVQARDKAPPNERPGIERLITRIEHERATARTEMEHFLEHIRAQRLQDETRRRFPTERSGGKVE